jgi:hypothetical protein
VRRRHLAQRCNGLLRARLLNEAHDGVEKHDGQDRDRLVGQVGVALVEPQSGGDHSRDEQENNEHIPELVEKFPPGRDGLFGRKLVSSVAFEARPCFRAAEPMLRIGPEGGQDNVNRLSVGRRWGC